MLTLLPVDEVELDRTNPRIRVRLDLGVRSRTHLQRTGNHHPLHGRAQQAHDHSRIARCLDNDLII
jgi:hypothetical protein